MEKNKFNRLKVALIASLILNLRLALTWLTCKLVPSVMAITGLLMGRRS